MAKKHLDKKILISALIISAILFGSGMLAGYGLNREKLSSIEKDMDSIIKDVQNFQLQFLFLDVLGENATCPLLAATLGGINEQSYRIGNKLESYSSESEIKDYNDYVDLKDEYSRLLVSYWLLALKLKRNCKLSANTIVYFYAKDCQRCDDQAFILTYLKNKYNEKLLVFALDADLEEPSVNTIKRYYNITEYPSLVVGNELYAGFHSRDSLEKILNL
ncbi:MAG: hypothetical protein DRO99_03155 [Candidatus Aenigmatarchaeota archaeon]|nr:MAG: hypothetical protein DRO99_03155 [Candidatus Aenigmarchaeota archaeon]